MATKSIMANVARLKKAEQWFNSMNSYKGDNVDNVVVLVRLFTANPGQEGEMRIELEPDSPEEQAVLDILEAACEKKCAKADALLEEYGMERTNKGILPKGVETPVKGFTPSK